MARRRFPRRAGPARAVTAAPFAVVALAVAVAVAGCGRAGGTSFVAEHPRAEGPLEVVLDDRTGRLLSLAAGEQVPGRERFGIVRADGLLPTVEVWWVGRSCDERVDVTLEQPGDRFRLEVSVTAGKSCPDTAVSRSILLTFAGDVTAEQFDVIVPTRVEGRRP